MGEVGCSGVKVWGLVGQAEDGWRSMHPPSDTSLKELRHVRRGWMMGCVVLRKYHWEGEVSMSSLWVGWGGVVVVAAAVVVRGRRKGRVGEGGKRSGWRTLINEIRLRHVKVRDVCACVCMCMCALRAYRRRHCFPLLPAMPHGMELGARRGCSREGVARGGGRKGGGG